MAVLQVVPATVWYRFVGGLNAQLRTVRKGSLRHTLLPVISWLNTHVNPRFGAHGIRVDLAWFHATASGYYQLGIVLNEAGDPPPAMQRSDSIESPTSLCVPILSPKRTELFGRFLSYRVCCLSVCMATFHNVSALKSQFMCRSNYSPVPRVGDFPPAQWQLSQSYNQLNASRRRIGGAILDAVTLPSLEDKGDKLFSTVLVRNVRPVGHQVRHSNSTAECLGESPPRLP